MKLFHIFPNFFDIPIPQVARLKFYKYSAFFLPPGQLLPLLWFCRTSLAVQYFPMASPFTPWAKPPPAAARGTPAMERKARRKTGNLAKIMPEMTGRWDRVESWG
jgi:hypothetical protein